MSIPESEWVWCGYPGHFVAARNCMMRLHMRVGDWRISTVGDYRPLHAKEEGPNEIGWGRYYETAIVRVVGDGHHGEGAVAGDHWIYGYEGKDPEPAEAGHMEWCRRVAAGWNPDDDPEAEL